MTHGNHADLTGTNIHVPYAWSYADAAARIAATGFAAGDVGKLARQEDDNSLWMLTDDDPETWVAVAMAGETLAFTDLIDCPDSYIGKGGKAVYVKADASGLEFL